MAITQALANSFKKEILDGVHLTTDTYKIALVKSTPAGTLDKTLTNYSGLGTDEVTGTGYTAGGVSLTTRASALSTDTAVLDFADPSWAAATFTARGAVIYNSTQGNKVLCVLDFGADKTCTNGTFTIVFPAADAANGLIRIA